MKNKKIFFKLSLSTLLLAGVVASCSDSFLDRPPVGTYSGDQLANKRGVEGILIGTYATLNGRTDAYLGGSSNWVFGSISSDEAYKGSESTDWADLNQQMWFDVQTTNAAVYQKWETTFDGIGMANDMINKLKNVSDVTDADKARLTAEARFLRGHHHFEGMRVFYRIPYIDETVSDYSTLKNDQPIWPQIETDLKYAYDNLTDKMPNKGRANKWTAAALLAKVYMFQAKYTEAKPVLDAIIASGTNADGVKLGLNDNYHDNFRVATKNSKESIFAVQSSVNDGAQGFNGNYENTLNYPHGSGDKPGGCCGFFQPSQNLVNSYKTDAATGLPLLDTFNNTDVTNDMGLESDAPFTPYSGTLDPRLDWSVGRRGIPYLDWGPHPGRSWIRKQDFGGPYSPKKNVHYKADIPSNYQAGTWGQATNAVNINLIRFADVLLWAAEAETEVGSLDKALEYVNLVRSRAANPSGFVTDAEGKPAANYKVGLYTAFPDKDFARKAIRFERKLELAMEGHRHFDLVRWGIAAETINAYLAGEVNNLSHLQGQKFDAGKDEFFPIPSNYLNQVKNQGIQQTPGY